MKAAYPLIAAFSIIGLWSQFPPTHTQTIEASESPSVRPARDTIPAPISVMVARSDWGLDNLSRIRFAQLSLARDDGEARLAVYRLSELASPADPDRVVGVEPDLDGNTFIVGEFTSGNRNRLGGFFGTFSQSPSTANARLARSPQAPRALELSFHKQPGAFCGAWIHLFDFRLAPGARRYLDVRRFSTLSFWIRGETGGERVLLKLADAEWEEREDALAVGEVADFLPSGRVEPTWQRAAVPLDRLPGRLDPSSLASVVFESLSPGSSRVYVSQLAFSLTPDSLPRLAGDTEPAFSARTADKATWIWNTVELLEDRAKLESVMDFLESDGFSTVFLQIPTPDDDPHPKTGLEIDRDQLRPLISALRARGLRVWALDGYAGYVLPEYRQGVLQTIERVIAYNRDVPPSDRFDGIRHDIEPYLLPGFQGPRRDLILGWTLELAAESARRAREAGLPYGADIPFWYDAPDEHLHKAVEVAFRGVRKPVSHHLIDLADDVAIMDYRTVAYGADGTIRHAEGELTYAQEQGKRIFIALETSPLPDEVLFEFRGQPELGPSSNPARRDQLLLEEVGDSVRVSLILEGETEAAKQASNRRSGTVYRWPVYRRTEVPATKLTFAELGSEALDEVMDDTAREFADMRSFAGFALHHAGSYQKLRQDSMTRPQP